MTALDGITRALREHGYEPRTGAGGNLVARCPAHDDHAPSLSLRQIEGQALIRCFADCDYRDVLAAVGLGPEALYDDPKGGYGTRYQYTDADGRVTRTVLRPIDKKAGRFSQAGETKLKQLFRLPKVVAAVAESRTVYLAEGEKDVLALESIGVVATTAPEGAGNFAKADIGPLKGAKVIAVVDRDGAGQRWAETVRARLAGYAETLRFVQAKVGKDAADHICAGYGIDGFEIIDIGVVPWEDPLPIGWQTDLPAFPVDALSPTVRHYVTALSAEAQTPVDMAATVSLGVGHGAIGGAVRIRLRPGYIEPTNQYCGLVAPPGSRKSKIVSECRKPLDLAERQLQAAMADEIEDAAVKRRALDMFAEKALRKAGESGDPTDIEIAQEAAAEARKVIVPPMPRLVMGDTTPERMIQLMRDHGRMVAISAEAGIVDALVGRHAKSKNLDPILKAHIGDRLDNETVGRGQETADSPALTLVFALQPYALHQLTDPTGDAAGRGLVARPLWSITPDITGTRTWDGSVEMDAAVRSNYETLLADVAIAMTLLPEPVTLTLAPAASKAIGEYHDRIEQLAAPGGECGAGLTREWIHKLVGAVGRIAAVLHVLAAPPPPPVRGMDGRIATDAAIGWTPAEVSESTVRAAIRIGEYYRAHAAAALGGGEDRRAPGARQLLSWLLARNAFVFTARDIQRSGPRPLRKASPLVEAIDYLQSLGWVRAAEGKGYELRPDAHTLATAATAATEPATPNVSAGHSATPEGVSPSPRLATVGDDRTIGWQLSPLVAETGDKAENALTSTDSGVVAAVAAVATMGATGRESNRATVGRRLHPVTAVCVGCGAEPTGKDDQGNPRCDRCMPLADDVEEWSA